VSKGGCQLTDDAIEKPTPVWEKELERAKIQAHINKLDRDQSHGQSIREPITQIKRDGELLWVFGDADRHERRVQRVVVSGCDRLF
jgi:hypothetical protein